MTGDLEQSRIAWRRAGRFPPNKEEVYPDHAAVQEFDQYRGIRVLEYGCGGGSDAMSYLRRGNAVWYVDIVPENVVAARQRIREAGLQEQAVGLVLERSAPIGSVPAHFFDVVNAHGVLHHIQDPGPVVAELFRVLKPRGVLYAMLYTEHLWEHHRLMIRTLMKMKQLSGAEAFGWCTDGEGVPYARSYTEQEGTALFAEAGFSPSPSVLYNLDYFRTFRVVKP